MHIRHLILCILSLSYIGHFDVINFRDVTTGDASEDNTAIFEFEFDPLTNLDTSLGYHLRLTWSQVSGPRSGVIEAVNSRYFKQPNAQLERIRSTGTYRLYVPIHFLGHGRLLVKLAINMSCTSYSYIHRYSRIWNRYCSGWQIRGTSDSLEISIKRG